MYKGFGVLFRAYRMAPKEDEEEETVVVKHWRSKKFRPL